MLTPCDTLTVQTLFLMNTHYIHGVMALLLTRHAAFVFQDRSSAMASLTPHTLLSNASSDF